MSDEMRNELHFVYGVILATPLEKVYLSSYTTTIYFYKNHLKTCPPYTIGCPLGCNSK